MSDTELIDGMERIAAKRGGGDRYATIGLMMDERCATVREALTRLIQRKNDGLKS